MTKLRDVGRDESLGRYASIVIIRCERCGCCWIRYFHEEEFRNAASRWAEALIDSEQAATILARDAAHYVGSAAFRIVGGSHYGHAGKRVEGPGWPAPPRPEHTPSSEELTFDARSR
jgi:hypothetical protein